jgi:hypothetical protein
LFEQILGSGFTQIQSSEISTLKYENIKSQLYLYQMSDNIRDFTYSSNLSPNGQLNIPIGINKVVKVMAFAIKLLRSRINESLTFEVIEWKGMMVYNDEVNY